jgi:hypothetical protein
MQYILLALVYFGALLHYGIIIDVAGSHVHKGVELYGKFDYYLFLLENLVESCGVVSIVSLSKSQVERP